VGYLMILGATYNLLALFFKIKRIEVAMGIKKSHKNCSLFSGSSILVGDQT
jgi:hypothetical protein